VSYSRTDDRITEFVFWSALAVYAATWVAGLGLGLRGEWLLAGATAAAYLGGHIYEMTRRNHCFLSADSTAAPASFLLFSVVVLCRWAVGYPPVPGKPLVLAWFIYGVVFMLGHLAALAYVGTFGLLLGFLFRHRIAREKERAAEPGHERPCPLP
jgi:hypothetical protein